MLHIPLSTQTFTGGNSLKIVNCGCHYKYDFLKKFLPVIESPIYGIVSHEDIVTAQSLNSFQNKLDKHWHFQELRFDWQAEITGTGSRSKVSLIQ